MLTGKNGGGKSHLLEAMSKRDLESGHVSTETVEKRVQLDVDACKVIIEGMNPTPIVYEPINVLMLAWKSGMTNKQ